MLSVYQCPLCPEFCSYYVPSFFCKPTSYKRTGPAFEEFWKTLASLGRFYYATIAFGVVPLFLPLAITAFGGPEGYFSLACIWSISVHCPQILVSLRKMEFRSLAALASLFNEVTVFKDLRFCSNSCAATNKNLPCEPIPPKFRGCHFAT